MFWTSLFLAKLQLVCSPTPIAVVDTGFSRVGEKAEHIRQIIIFGQFSPKNCMTLNKWVERKRCTSCLTALNPPVIQIIVFETAFCGICNITAPSRKMFWACTIIFLPPASERYVNVVFSRVWPPDRGDPYHMMHRADS